MELQWELYDLAREYTAERGHEAVGTTTWPTGCWIAGKPSCRGSRAIRSPWRTSSTGWRNSGWSRLTVSVTASTGRTRGWLRLIFSITTCALEVALRTAWRWKAHRRRGGGAGDHGAPADHAGLLPRPMPAAFLPAIVAANWDSVVFDIGEDSLRRVPMMEPLKGTALHVDTLFEGCNTPAELLRRLGS